LRGESARGGVGCTHNDHLEHPVLEGALECGALQLECQLRRFLRDVDATYNSVAHVELQGKERERVNFGREEALEKRGAARTAPVQAAPRIQNVTDVYTYDVTDFPHEFLTSFINELKSELSACSHHHSHQERENLVQFTDCLTLFIQKTCSQNSNGSTQGQAKVY